ncbi:MAG: hypothetical protein Kow0045_24630 [Albidovulum sp.]
MPGDQGEAKAERDRFVHRTFQSYDWNDDSEGPEASHAQTFKPGQCGGANQDFLTFAAPDTGAAPCKILSFAWTFRRRGQRSIAPLPERIFSRNLSIRFTRVADCLA